MKRTFLITALLILFAAEILRVYFIMPFPGSQQKNTIALAYWIGHNIFWIRILALAIISFCLVDIFKSTKVWPKFALGAVLVFYAVVFFFFNYRFEADKMFYQPKQKVFVDASADTTDKDELVIGVAVNGEAKAYPIQIIGYHHQVMDTVDHTPIMVTYCTVCRTGRVFSPFVNGRKASFRLVGMDHYNAMFEDAETGTWWRQATGEAIAGPMKGASFKEIESKQMTLAAWLREYPNSAVMQPDNLFKKDYADLAGYDDGTIKGSLEKRDSASWKRKSWVIGVIHNHTSKAYDWNELTKQKVINDAIGGSPVVLAVEKDGASFHVYNSIVKGAELHFEAASNGALVDNKTHSTWNIDGVCIDGTLKGEKLNPVQSYQEFWHSWSTFHPNTLKYNIEGPLNQVKI